MIYFGIADQGNNIWGIRIPDLPGCCGGGRSFNEAVEDAISAASDWTEHRIKKGRSVPAPSNLEAVKSLAEDNEFVLEIPVSHM